MYFKKAKIKYEKDVSKKINKSKSKGKGSSLTRGGDRRILRGELALGFLAARAKRETCGAMVHSDQTASRPARRGCLPC